MKTTQEMSTVDRISTHEELHQVLALLSDSAERVATETASEPEEEDSLREAVAGLWPEAEADGQKQTESDMYRWAELAGKLERVN